MLSCLPSPQLHVIHHDRSRRGTAAIEFAIIAPILSLLMLGMLEVTRAIQVKNYLTDAARSGCRVAIQPGNNTQKVTDNINAILSADGIDTTKVTTTILVNGNNVDVSTALKYDTISVKVAVPISAVSWVPLVYFTSTEVDSETLVMAHY
jgi:Flp pilus assembly protein TadG